VFEKIRFQRRGLLRFQAVMERASWHSDGLGETECFREIFGISQGEFLTIKIPDSLSDVVPIFIPAWKGQLANQATNRYRIE
jgi:hypothetical protein